MGAERWLLFTPQAEADKVRAYLTEPEVGVEGEFGVWFEWKDEHVLKLCYTSGPFNSTFAAILCRELALRFTVSGIGADSVGWYDDAEWQLDPNPMHESYGVFNSWTEWIRAYNPRKFDRAFRMYPDEGAIVTSLEGATKEFFDKLDAAALG
jgi:hypothetical protein